MSSLVVVNPSMLHSLGKPAGAKPRYELLEWLDASFVLTIGPCSNKKKPAQQPKKEKAKQDSSKTKQKSRGKDNAAGKIITSAPTAVGAAGETTPGSMSVLRVSDAKHCLAAVYWMLLARSTKRSSVIVLPNANKGRETQLTVQQVAGIFRNLGFQTVGIHKKMTPGQRKVSTDRLQASCKRNNSASPLVVVTTEHFVASTKCAQADVLLLNADLAANTAAYSSFAHIYLATADTQQAPEADSFEPAMTNNELSQLQARQKIATQIVEISQRIGQNGARDVDDKWADKLAKGAGLEEDDDDDDKRAAKKRKKALSPDEQRLLALTEKLCVLLARKIEQGAGSQTKPGGVSAAAPGGDRSEKLQVLGLVTISASIGSSISDERTSAQTRWMDAALGSQHGGEWQGDVRHGASKDAASLALRRRFCSCQTAKATPETKHWKQWNPNKLPLDTDKWGGEYGKVCGHNEVVMHSLRPFFPQEVLNSKICSRIFPAPGNQGFDGCLEHLRLSCMDHKRPMTIWDAEAFVYITATGKVTWTKKNQLLDLSLASLQCLMTNLRSWTLESQGQLPPATLMEAIQLCCQLGDGDLRSPVLEMKLVKRIMGFTLGGSVRLWKQIARAPHPLATEDIY